MLNLFYTVPGCSIWQIFNKYWRDGNTKDLGMDDQYKIKVAKK